MQNRSVAAIVAALTAVSAVDAGVLTYSQRSLVAGISNGDIPDAVTDSSFDPWFGSRYGTADGLVQFAGIGSSLFDDEFTISANAAISTATGGFGGYAAYSNFTLNFTVTEDAFVTFFLDMGSANPDGAVLVLECMGADGAVFSYSQPVESNFVRTLAAGNYAMFGSIRIEACPDDATLNSGLLSVAANAVAVPGPATLVAFAIFGLVGSRRRR